MMIEPLTDISSPKPYYYAEPVMSDLLNIAESILRRYPLCDRCFGRFFASLGRGLSNDVRGRSLKTSILMNLFYRNMSSGSETLRSNLQELARNGGEPFRSSLKILTGDDVEIRKCYVCGSSIEDLILEYSDRVVRILERERISRFLLGVRVPRELVEREEEIAREFSISTWESIKNELKREIGKRVMMKGFKPEFEDPDAIITIDLTVNVITISRPSLMYVVRIRKNERGFRIRGPENSLEKLLEEKLSNLSPEYVRIHTTTRDSYRYRITDEGVFAVLEIHAPKRRDMDLKDLQVLLRELQPFEIEIISRGFRKDVRELNNRLSKTIYRIKVECSRDLKDEEIEKIKSMGVMTVTQHTPSRFVSRGAPETTRRGVASLREFTRINDKVYSIVVVIDKRLFPEEFISGDGGRTSPSLSEVLGVELKPLEVDIIGQA